MPYELCYTSAPRGLMPGKSGFCTVAATRQMPPGLRERLEGLSSYRPLFPPHQANGAANPIVHSHLCLSLHGQTYHVLSRIGPTELDHTGRSNLFAHHVVLGSDELPAGGPAWLLQNPELKLESSWQGPPRQLEGRPLPRGDVAAGPAKAWKAASGDAGWAGVLAERFEQDPSRPVYLIFEPGFDPLRLLAEALALLPPKQRWQVTFTTYFTGLQPGLSCAWRCVPQGSREAEQVASLPGTINLCAPLGKAHGGALVEQARSGRRPAVAAVESARPVPGLIPRPANGAWSKTAPEAPLSAQTAPSRTAVEAPRRGRLLPFAGGVVAGMLLMAFVSATLWLFLVGPGIADQRKEIETLRSELEVQKKQVASLVDTNKEKDIKIRDLSQEKQKLSNQRDDNKGRVEMLTKELDDQKKKQGGNSEEAKKLNRELAEKGKQLEEKDRALKSRDQTLDAIKKAADTETKIESTFSAAIGKVREGKVRPQEAETAFQEFIVGLKNSTRKDEFDAAVKVYHVMKQKYEESNNYRKAGQFRDAKKSADDSQDKYDKLGKSYKESAAKKQADQDNMKDKLDKLKQKIEAKDTTDDS